MRGLGALIIEPQRPLRDGLRQMLVQCGLGRIDDATSAAEAIGRLRALQYDMILCEYDLGDGQDGQQLLEDLRHHRLISAATMFFMVTGEGNVARIVSAAELAPTDYILKPFTADTMLERIGRALDKRSAFLPLHQLIGQGRERDAIAACVAGARAQPRYAVDFMRLRAELHLQQGEAAEAEAIYAALYEARGIAWARLGQAQALVQRNRHDEAGVMLEALLQQHKKFVEAYDWLARTHLALGRPQQAQQVLAAALLLSPHALRRLRTLSRVALENGDLDTAEQALKQVVGKARHSAFRDPQDHARLVQTLVRKGDPVQAAAVIRDLEHNMDGRSNAAACGAIATAMLHDYTGNGERLAEALQRAVSACADSTGLADDLKLELCRNCLDNGRADAAGDLLRDVMRNAPDGAAMARAMAVFERAGRHDEALLLAHASRQDVADMVAAGAARARDGDYRGAVELMGAAAGRLPDNPQVAFNAAVAVLKCLEHDGWDERLGQAALGHIGAVRRIDPHNAKLATLSGMHQQILRKYNILAGHWTGQGTLPAP